MQWMRTSRTGATIVEILIVIGITVVLSVIVAANFASRKQTVDVQGATERIVAVLREAQTNSATRLDGETWSVRFTAATTTRPYYELLAGSSPRGRYNLSPQLVFDTSTFNGSSILTVTFSGRRGKAGGTSTIRVALAGSSVQSSTVGISCAGLIQYAAAPSTCAVAVGGPVDPGGDLSLATSTYYAGSGSDLWYSSVAVVGSYVYLVGTDDWPWVIEKLNKDDFSLVYRITTNNVAGSEPYEIKVDDTNEYMYIIGNQDYGFRIEKRPLVNASSTAYTKDTSDDFGLTLALDVDNDVFYAGGQNGSGAWIIQKRDMDAGNYVSGFGSSGRVTSVTGAVYEMDVDSSGGYLYSAGVDSSNNWRIEKRLTSDGSLVSGFGSGGVVTSSGGHHCTGGEDPICFGMDINVSGGYLLIAGVDDSGNWRIEKRLLSNGSLVSAFGSSGVITGVSGYAVSVDVYAAGGYFHVAGNASTDWRFERRDITDGSLLASDSVNLGSSLDVPWDMVSVGGFQYVVGTRSWTRAYIYVRY